MPIERKSHKLCILIHFHTNERFLEQRTHTHTKYKLNSNEHQPTRANQKYAEQDIDYHSHETSETDSEDTAPADGYIDATTEMVVTHDDDEKESESRGDHVTAGGEVVPPPPPQSNVQLSGVHQQQQIRMNYQVMQQPQMDIMPQDMQYMQGGNQMGMDNNMIPPPPAVGGNVQLAYGNGGDKTDSSDEYSEDSDNDVVGDVTIGGDIVSGITVGADDDVQLQMDDEDEDDDYVDHRTAGMDISESDDDEVSDDEEESDDDQGGEGGNEYR